MNQFLLSSDDGVAIRKNSVLAMHHSSTKFARMRHCAFHWLKVMKMVAFHAHCYRHCRNPLPTILALVHWFLLTLGVNISRTATHTVWIISLYCHTPKMINYRLIGLMVWTLTNVQWDRGSIPDRVILKTQKWYRMPPCLTLNIIRQGSNISWAIQGK